MKRLLSVVAAVGLSVGIVLIPGSATATKSAAGAPECAMVRLLNPDATRVWLEFCGGGPGQEQALHNWANGSTVLVDGASVQANGCGSRSSPCVLFSTTSTPPS
jgi:hypothetical protein